MHLVSFIVVSPLQQGPTGGDDNQSSADLDRRQRDSEERQNVRPNQVRANQQEETVDRDLPRERPARLRADIRRVNERKMGLPPSGSTIGKRALTMRKMFLAVSIAASLVSFACPGEFRMLGWVRAWETREIRRPDCSCFEAGAKMTPEAEHYTLDSTLDSVEKIEHLVLEHARRAGFCGISLEQIALAVHETAANAVFHGNQESAPRKKSPWSSAQPGTSSRS